VSGEAGRPAEVEAVLFDIDGTLIETGGAGAEAWRRAFEELYGVPADITEYTHAGMTDPEVGEVTFKAVVGREPSGRELAQLMGRRLHHLGEAVADADGYEVLPGAEVRLETLIDEGMLLGLTTGNVEASAHIKLARARLNRFFSFGGYGSDSSDRAELTARAVQRAGVVSGGRVAAAACIAVGDTPLDVQAGHGAGIRVVGVASGAFTVDQLTEAGADFAIQSLGEGFPA
jgi:phosphoglycolate phosphatase